MLHLLCIIAIKHLNTAPHYIISKHMIVTFLVVHIRCQFLHLHESYCSCAGLLLIISVLHIFSILSLYSLSCWSQPITAQICLHALYSTKPTVSQHNMHFPCFPSCVPLIFTQPNMYHTCIIMMNSYLDYVGISVIPKFTTHFTFKVTILPLSNIEHVQQGKCVWNLLIWIWLDDKK